MQHDFDYLIIGAGMAGEAAAQALRAADAKATIGMLGDESHPPYDRPPLSKKLWKDASKESGIWRAVDKAQVIGFAEFFDWIRKRHILGQSLGFARHNRCILTNEKLICHRDRSPWRGYHLH